MFNDILSRVKFLKRKQYGRIADGKAAALALPREGWLSTFRQALGMSASQLAKRAKVTRAAIYQAQRNELESGISLRQMEKLANAMGARFVYAIVPDGSVDSMVQAQAMRKARSLVERASAHMALEAQSVDAKHREEEIESLAFELAREMPANFWDAD